MIEVGNKVRYTAAFLKSIGAYTGPTGFMTGEVQSIKDLGSLTIATVKWDDGDEGGCNVKCLIQCGKPDYSGM